MNNTGTVILDGGATAIDVATNETFNNLTINPSTLGAIKTVANSDTLLVSGTLTLTEGQVNQTTIPAGGTIAARGNITHAATFDGGTGTLVIDGGGAQTLTPNSTGTFLRTTVNKAAGTVTLAADLSLPQAETFTITSGTFDQGATFSLTSGAISIAAGGTLSNTGTGDLTLAGNVANAGTITLDGGGAGAGHADSISIRSSAMGTQRTWSGAGTFTVRDADIQDQLADATQPGSIFANSCTDSSNNTRFSFNNPVRPSISSASINGVALTLPSTNTFYPNYGEALEINFTAGDSDSQDTVTLSTPTVPGMGTFTAASAANPGTAMFAFSTSSQDWGATYTFTVRSTDNFGVTSASDLTVTIVGPGAAPPNLQPVITPPTSDPGPSSSSPQIVTVQQPVQPIIPPKPSLPKSPVLPGGIDISTYKPPSLPGGIDISTFGKPPISGGGIDISTYGKPPLPGSPVPPSGIDISTFGKPPIPPAGIDISTFGKPPVQPASEDGLGGRPSPEEPVEIGVPESPVVEDSEEESDEDSEVSPAKPKPNKPKPNKPKPHKPKPKKPKR